MDNIIGREKRDNSLLVQCKSIFYVSSLPNLQNQRTARAQSVSSSPEAVPSDDDVKNHLFLAHPRPDGLLSENEEKSTPNFEVSEPKLSQKSTESPTMEETYEEGGCRNAERSVSDLRSLFERKITEGNASSPACKRPISIDTGNPDSATLPNPNNLLSPIKTRMTTAVPPTQKKDTSFSLRKSSYQPPPSENLYNNGVTMDSKQNQTPASEISNGHHCASEANPPKSSVSRQEYQKTIGTSAPRRVSYSYNPQQQTVDDTYSVSQSKSSRKSSRASRGTEQSRRSTCTILPSVDGETRPSVSEFVHRERISNSTFYTAVSSPSPAPLSETRKTSSTEDRYYDLNYSPLFRRRSCAADSCFFSFRGSSTSSFFSQTSSPAFESTRLKSMDQESEIAEDPNEEDDAPEEECHMSVIDLIAKFSGQSEARRQTVLQNSGIRVDLPAKDASKFFLNPNDSASGDTRESQVKVSYSEQQKHLPKMDVDSTNADPIVVPEDHGVMTVNVQPVDAVSRRKDGCQAPLAEKNSWVKDKVVIASGVLNGLSDKERKIQESLFEILENEEMYYRSMKYVVIDHFHRKLMHQFPAESYPQFSQPLRTIFKFLGDFAEISDKLLGELERRRGDSPWMVPFFDILIDFVTNVMATPYKRYSVLKQRQEEELSNCRKDQWFCDVLSALNRDPMTGGLTLDAFLILPIQHATRYSLLLETVLKKLDPSDERYGPAQQAHEETRAFAEAINRETDKMEYLFELTTVLAGLKNLPTDKTGKLEKILHEGKKGNSILMFGREVSFGRTRRGFINFKQTDKLVLFAWSNYLLIVKELNQIGQFSFETLARNGRASDGLEIFQELQISSFPKTVDVTKLLLIDFDPVIQSSDNPTNQFLLYCSNATKKKWKQAFES